MDQYNLYFLINQTIWAETGLIETDRLIVCLYNDTQRFCLCLLFHAKSAKSVDQPSYMHGYTGFVWITHHWRWQLVDVLEVLLHFCNHKTKYEVTAKRSHPDGNHRHGCEKLAPRNTLFLIRNEQLRCVSFQCLIR